MFAGDTIYTIRTYPNCSDTLTYSQKQIKADSTIISEGSLVNGKKEGEWVYNGYQKRTVTYRSGIETDERSYDKDGRLELESILGKDSLYFERQFYGNGAVALERYVNLEGYLTGHGIEYDSLGRKMAEGEYIAEPVMPDTAFIPSPDPPHDMQQTIITENGGMHGPWIYFDVDGNVIDTVTFDRGQAAWTGNIVGKWRIDSIATEDTSSLGAVALVVGMALSDLQGFEFTDNYEMIHFDGKGKQLAVGSYSMSRNRTMLFTMNNDEENDVWIRELTPTRLKLLTEQITLYFVRAE